VIGLTAMNFMRSQPRPQPAGLLHYGGFWLRAWLGSPQLVKSDRFSRIPEA
jgi:hypothetical protein